MRYAISDLHLGHENIIEYCDRPFADVTEMNEELIANWNRTVDPSDVVYFLGDLGAFADEEQLRYWLSKLTGQIVFIEGNHDSPCRTVDGLNTHDFYILDADVPLCFTHKPENAPRFWDGWIVHGHHHNNQPETYPYMNHRKKRVNVSVEMVDYAPVPIEEIIDDICGGEPP